MRAWPGAIESHLAAIGAQLWQCRLMRRRTMPAAFAVALLVVGQLLKFFGVDTIRFNFHRLEMGVGGKEQLVRPEAVIGII